MNLTALPPDERQTNEVIHAAIHSPLPQESQSPNFSPPLLFLEDNCPLSLDDQNYLRCVFKETPIGNKVIRILSKILNPAKAAC
jgi:hypothetical protein